jgi:hypothetical protein
LLFLPDRRIEPKRPESLPPSPILPADLRAAAAKLTAVGTPPAEPTPPSTSW